MKQAVITMLAIAAFAASAFAADVMEFPASMGKVTFPHKKHQQLLKNCKKCHEQGPGKIEGFGKEWAHKTCKGCHAEMQKGPSKCSECHKK